MFKHDHPYLEPVTPDGLAMLERGWQRLVSEIGIRFDHPDVLRILTAEGQRIDDGIAYLDPEWVLEMVGRAPTQFAFHARNAERSIVMGGPHSVFMPAQAAPFARRGDERREAEFRDVEDLIRISHVVAEYDLPGNWPCEPNDLPLDSRHLDVLRANVTLTDKPLGAHSISVDTAEDGLAVARIVFGERIERDAVSYVNVNANSPLVFDGRMLDALLVYARAGQPVFVVPFLLMGAMAPTSTPAALAQQFAESLAGIALIQAVNPGAPCVLGSFLSTVDMRNGSPAFGGPESHFGLLASGQMARRYGLPWRAGGGALTSSLLPDAQAGWEGMNTMQAAFLAGANVHMHCGGWLEGNLVVSFEKLVVDLEMLRTLIAEFTPVDIDEASLAFDAHAEVRHGGHFFGAAHTMERYRDCFHQPLLATTDNHQRWSRNGSPDAATRATAVYQRLLADYEPPDLDDGIRDELDAFVERRRRELGD